MNSNFHAVSLSEWLHHLENGVAGGYIEMGLARVESVRKQMQLEPNCPVIVVAGTNGKGSVCAYLTQIYKEAGYRVGTLTSPHLLYFNERIAVNGQPVTDAEIISAFESIEAARGHTILTYFEFNTLAAVMIFNRQQTDIMILEVGLGGRLDAVNIFDANVSVITSVDLDHETYLGNTIEKVAYEKAGVMRTGKPTVFGQTDVPVSLQNYAQSIGANLLIYGKDFACINQDKSKWTFDFGCQNVTGLSDLHRAYNLPIPALSGSFQLSNAACAIAAVECLGEQLPVDVEAVKQGLIKVKLLGRFQILSEYPTVILDVGHNPHAARALRDSLKTLPVANKQLAVFSMLADKDIDTVLGIMNDQIDKWYIAPLSLPRGLNIEKLQENFVKYDINQISVFDNICIAYQEALSHASVNDRIVVFGSFHTVADIMAFLQMNAETHPEQRRLV